MTKDLTKKAVELLLKGATMVSDPCPYCKGVRLIKDGNAFCVSCGKEADEEKMQSILTGSDLDQKLKDLAEDLQKENDYERQKKILHSINEIINMKEKSRKI